MMPRNASDRRPADASLDGALLKQAGLLATLVTAPHDAGRARFVDHAELMRLVKSQQSLLSAARLNDAGSVFPSHRMGC